MFTKHLRVNWRQLTKNKVYSFLNIIGLTTGMAVSMIISLWMYPSFLPTIILPILIRCIR